MRRMLDVEIPVKRRRGRPTLRWKDVCQRDMREAHSNMTKQQTGQHGGIRSLDIPADYGTSQEK